MNDQDQDCIESSLSSVSLNNSIQTKKDLYLILEDLTTNLGAKVATLFLYDEMNEQFYLPVGYGLLDTDTFANPRMGPRIERVAGKIVRDRAPIIADRVSDNPIMDGPFARRERIKSAAGFPILSDTGEPLGVLFISFRDQIHAFSSRDEKIIWDATRRAAHKITQADFSSELLSMKTRNPSELEQTLKAISNIAYNVLNLPVAIWVTDHAREHLRIHSFAGLTDDYIKNAITYIGDGSLVDQVIKDNKLITVMDVLNDKRFRYPEKARKAGWSSVLAYPVKSGGQKSVIELFSFETNRFELGEKDTLKYLGELVSVTLANTRHLTETRELAEITQALSATPDFGRAMQVIVEKARNLTGATSSTIFLLDRHTNNFSIGARSPILEQSQRELPRPAGGLTRQIIDEGKSILISDVLDNLRVRDAVKQEGTRSLLGVPLSVANDRVGVLFLSSQRRDHFTEDDIMLMQTLANHAAISLGWARLLLTLSGEIEQAIAELFRMDEILSEVCNTIQTSLGFDFAAVQLIRPEEDIIETVFGSGVAADWSGRAKHYLEKNPILRDIQADIALTGQVEIIVGKDSRFDKWVFEEFHHDRLVRVFVPIFILRDEKGKVLEDWIQYLVWKVNQQTPDKRRTVIEVIKPTQPEWGETTLEVIGTIEAGYMDSRKRISNEQASKLLEMAALSALSIRKAQLPFVLESLTTHAMRIMQADSASLHYYYLQQQKQYLHEVCSGNITLRFLQQHKPRKDGLGRQAINEGKYKYVPDLAQSQGDAALKEINPGVFREGIRALAAFPLVVEQNEGVLYTHFHHQHHFTKDELDWVELFVRRAAYAVRYATLYIQIKERARQLTTLHAVALLLSSSTEGAELLKQCAWNTLNILAADVVTLYEYIEAEQKFLTPPYIAGRLSIDQAMTTEIHPQDAPSLLVQSKRNVYAVQSKKNRVLNNLNRPRLVNKISFVEREMIYSSAGVLLRVETEIVGVMFINYRRQHHFSKDERQIIETLASSAALAIKNRRLPESLTDVDRELITTLDLEKLLSLIVVKAVQVTNAEIGDIRLYEKFHNELVMHARVPEEEPVDPSFRRIKVGEGITGWVAKHKQSILISDVRKDKRYKAFFRGALSELCVPLLDEDNHLLGILNMESRTSRFFSKKDLLAVEALANQAVIAIQNAKRQKRIVANETIAILGDLAANMLHKMTNDISAIRAEARSMRDKTRRDKGTIVQIERIHSLSLRILDNVYNLRRWTLESPGPVDLKEVLIGAKEDVRIKSSISLELDIPDFVPEIWGSQHLLVEIFAELIRNSTKAIIGNGKITISIMNVILDDRRMNVVQVEDTGRGIPIEDLERIFERGYTSHIYAGGEGLGFGLWWIRSYIERLEGDISVESELGKGSKFTVVLPCVESALHQA